MPHSKNKGLKLNNNMRTIFTMLPKIQTCKICHNAHESSNELQLEFKFSLEVYKLNVKRNYILVPILTEKSTNQEI